jgi:hypothetical protein
MSNGAKRVDFCMVSAILSPALPSLCDDCGSLGSADWRPCDFGDRENVLSQVGAICGRRHRAL